MWTIVIISTDLRMTAGLRAALERAGINPIVTASILTAILIIQNTRVDIVLCDSNVEGGTGIASCLAIRSEFGIRAPKMMVLDDVDSVSTRAAAMYAGARDILLKSNPISENVSAVWKRIESGTASNPADDAVVAGGTGGIPDRARLERRMKQEWDYAVRHDSPLTCILLAPDRIDAIGSCMGHDIAQRIVVQSAQAMKGMLRARDFWDGLMNTSSVRCFRKWIWKRDGNTRSGPSIC